jgi:hypothetical protein
MKWAALYSRRMKPEYISSATSAPLRETCFSLLHQLLIPKCFELVFNTSQTDAQEVHVAVNAEELAS